MRIFILLLTALGLALPSCSENEMHADSVPPPPIEGIDSAFGAAAAPVLPDAKPENHPDLHQVFRLSTNIISGGEPQGKSGLERIAAMGVKTILSVDGKTPDAEVAASLGMRYVHVPIQYRGLTDDEMTKIAKAFRELESPFYVHCFHGKHRGPAAAAVGRVVLDGASRQQAIAEMRQWCGTSEKYEGLYLSLASGSIPWADQTRDFDWDFPAIHRLEGFRQSMVEAARAFDQLKFLWRRGWTPDPEHPDVDPVNESEKLAQILDACGKLDSVAERPADFRAWRAESASEARRLHTLLTKAREGNDAAREQAGMAFTGVSNLCSRCHSAYRND